MFCQIFLSIVENLPSQVAELRFRLAVVPKGFQVDDYRTIVAVQFFAYGHEGEQVFVVGDVGHDVAGKDAGPFPACGAYLVGRNAKDHCGGVNKMVDECWGHQLNTAVTARRSYQMGDKVFVTWSPEDCILMNQEGSAPPSEQSSEAHASGALEVEENSSDDKLQNLAQGARIGTH